MSLHHRLRAFVERTIEENGKELDGPLTDNASLLRSGLLDSLALLQLAAWVEAEVDAPLDLTGLDLAAEWDTMADIVQFIERSQRSH